jgi:hypothetical protein
LLYFISFYILSVFKVHNKIFTWNGILEEWYSRSLFRGTKSNNNLIILNCFLSKNETIVRLNKVVDEIDWLNSSNEKKVRIKCSDGELFQADVVIFTGNFFRTCFEPVSNFFQTCFELLYKLAQTSFELLLNFFQISLFPFFFIWTFLVFTCVLILSYFCSSFFKF